MGLNYNRLAEIIIDEIMVLRHTSECCRGKKADVGALLPRVGITAEEIGFVLLPSICLCFASFPPLLTSQARPGRGHGL